MVHVSLQELIATLRSRVGTFVKITAEQAVPERLAAFAENAAQMLIAGRYEELAASFGYALAFGRDCASAIRLDLARCLAELGATRLVDTVGSITVSTFAADADVIALVECMLSAEPEGRVLMELVVTGSRAQLHLTLEQLTGFS